MFSFGSFPSPCLHYFYSSTSSVICFSRPWASWFFLLFHLGCIFLLCIPRNFRLDVRHCLFYFFGCWRAYIPRNTLEVCSRIRLGQMGVAWSFLVLLLSGTRGAFSFGLVLFYCWDHILLGTLAACCPMSYEVFKWLMGKRLFLTWHEPSVVPSNALMVLSLALGSFLWAELLLSWDSGAPFVDLWSSNPVLFPL